ncbi:MAG: hypothetical protein P8127_00580 [Acidobacteriota bacterium]
MLDRGWFFGPEECVRVLKREAPVDCVAGGGFGRSWPVLVGSGRWTIAPGMPVALGSSAAMGGGCEFRRDGGVILRDAAGTESPFLVDDDSGPAPGEPFDLMWFGDTESYTVHGGVLEIQDLFGVLRVPATREILEELVVRTRRVPATSLSSIDFGDSAGSQVVEVSRAVALIAHDRWRNPSTLLEAREDITRATARGDDIRVTLVTGESAVFCCEVSANGWRLSLRRGAYPLREIRLERRDDWLVLSAALARRIDGTAPGMRQRLIFDLRTDLVKLG